MFTSSGLAILDIMVIRTCEGRLETWNENVQLLQFLQYVTQSHNFLNDNISPFHHTSLESIVNKCHPDFDSQVFKLINYLWGKIKETQDHYDTCLSTLIKIFSKNPELFEKLIQTLEGPSFWNFTIPRNLLKNLSFPQFFSYHSV